MRVLIVQNIAAIAGSENYILAIVPELISKGAEIHFLNIYLKKDQEIAKHYNSLLEEKGVDCHSLALNNYYTIRPVKKILTIVKECDINIVHSHLIYSDFWTSLAKFYKPNNFKSVSCLHAYQENLYVEYCRKPEKLPKTLYYYLHKFCDKYADVIYACSYGLRDFYQRAGLDPKERIQVIQHGFNYREIADNYENHRISEVQLCIAGRLIERKGHHFVLNILPELIRDFPRIKLVIAGSGENELSLKAMVRQKGIEDAVVFLGYVNETLELMKASDLVLVPSFAEGLPLVIFEAFHSGTPVIAFNTIGCSEAIRDGETGILVDAFDEKMLEKRIVELLKSEIKRAKLSAGAEKELKGHFNLNRMTDETFSVYSMLLS